MGEIAHQVEIDCKITQPSTKVMHECPQQTNQQHLEQRIAQNVHQLGIGLDRGQAVLQHQQQKRQRNKQQQAADTMEN